VLSRLINFALDQKAATLLFVAILVLFGVYAYRQVPVQAFPDPDDVHVQVIILWPGRAAEEVESVVTLPAEQQLNGTPGLTNLRSVSMFGLSVVTLTFEDGVDDNFARAQVLEKMQAVTLPTDAQWQLAALTTSTGEVYRYIICGPRESIAELRAIEDWVVEPRLRQVSGVADVVPFGGGIKQYQVVVSPALLAQHNVTLAQAATALQNNNTNVGGGRMRAGEQMFVIRGVGLATDIADIGRIVVTSLDGRPVYVRDIAEVRTGMAPREGAVSYFKAADPGRGTAPSVRPASLTDAAASNTGADEIEDVVEGIVLNRKGTNALTVIDGIKQQVAFMNSYVLPRGVRLVEVYNRSELVHQTVHTVLQNLMEGAALVLLILLVFTSSLRGALIVAAVIPLSLLTAFLALYLADTPANLLSFGAVDFGIIVDAAVVIVEAVLVKRLLSDARESMTEVVRHTASHLGRPILFSKLIVIISLVPIFTFQRVEGRIFRPLAYTVAAAIIGATILTLTLTPLACATLLGGGRRSGPSLLVRAITTAYDRALRLALRFRAASIAATLLLVGGTVLIGSRLGTEFLPRLDEGNIWLVIKMPLSTSRERALETSREVREILKGFPESRLFYAQQGRPDDGTDAKGQNNLEIAVYLRPRSEWTTRDERGRVVDKEGLIRLMNEKLQRLPGLELNFSQVIEDNVNEALSGVQGELAVKVFGDDLRVLQTTGEKIRTVMAGVPGVADLAVEQISGQPNVNIVLRREDISRYGLDAQTVLSLVETGLGGKVVGSILEGQRRFDLCLRLGEEWRQTPEQIGRLWVDTSGGQRIPLAQLADIRLEEGASRIARDGNSRRIALKCGVRGRDMGGFVAEAQRAVARQVKLPPGYTVTWEGQFENQRRATARLAIVVPLSILAVFTLLFWAFQRLRYALLIILNVPLALIGGVALLYFSGTNLSVSAMIGFIFLFGASVQNGLILVGQFNTLRATGRPLHEAVVEGAHARVRPVLMTALMASLGMLPASISHGIGSEVQRPLALVILGGMLSAVVLTLFLLPVLYEWAETVWPAPVSAPEGLIE
jgi:cobalt-zinc-cadmium resistance protein CzcA